MKQKGCSGIFPVKHAVGILGSLLMWPLPVKQDAQIQFCVKYVALVVVCIISLIGGFRWSSFWTHLLWCSFKNYNYVT